jgi:hypothetical protein
VDDEQSLRQRYILGTLWFFIPTPTRWGFGTATHAASWTSNIDECDWLGVECDDNGHVTDLMLRNSYVRGQIPHDLGLLTDLTSLSLGGNKLTGTITSSLGALTALTSLFLDYNGLVGTMPFCNSDQAFRSLVADCARVNCTCCTDCCPGAPGRMSTYCLQGTSRTRTK